MPFPLPVVLASTSKYRKELLSRLNIPFETHAPEFDESTQLAGPDLSLHALNLAKGKAESLQNRFPRALIIGSDQVAELEGQVLHKPGTHDRASSQLQLLQGRVHKLHTAVAVVNPDGKRIWTHVDSHQMHMRELSLHEIQNYLRADKPLDCCGSYKIECLGISLFEKIRGDDFTAISGLPLMALSKILRRAAFEITS